MNLSIVLFVALGLGVGVLLGGGLYALWVRYKSADETDPPLPAKWPLRARGLLTGEEHDVLNWLREAFPKHLVMVKLPVVRFTIPLSKDTTSESKRLQALLDGVYCSFTVCTTGGNVAGCVDVPGKRGLPRGNRDLKESLLSDCAIAYTVVRGFDLPKAAAMRAAFLGEIDPEEKQEHQETRGGDSSFHADLDAFTRKARADAKEAALKELNKDSDAKRLPVNVAGFNPDGTHAGSLKPARFPVEWEDSFIQPSDSRPAKLDTL